ncbi:maker51 [Drosophila busckii]|uniref:Maker51 n=1 Tax=Drosophila busckii TaxID=30019 RepID=A0A0M3QUT6_DROBS|nr:maker51 [Drosophila busckii]
MHRRLRKKMDISHGFSTPPLMSASSFVSPMIRFFFLFLNLSKTTPTLIILVP